MSKCAYVIHATLLQELTARYLEQLSSGTSLSLAAFRPSTKGAAEIERITKVHMLLYLPDANSGAGVMLHCTRQTLQAHMLQLARVCKR